MASEEVPPGLPSGGGAGGGQGRTGNAGTVGAAFRVDSKSLKDLHDTWRQLVTDIRDVNRELRNLGQAKTHIDDLTRSANQLRQAVSGSQARFAGGAGGVTDLGHQQPGAGSKMPNTPSPDFGGVLQVRGGAGGAGGAGGIGGAGGMGGAGGAGGAGGGRGRLQVTPGAVAGGATGAAILGLGRGLSSNLPDIMAAQQFALYQQRFSAGPTTSRNAIDFLFGGRGNVGVGGFATTQEAMQGAGILNQQMGRGLTSTAQGRTTATAAGRAGALMQDFGSGATVATAGLQPGMANQLRSIGIESRPGGQPIAPEQLARQVLTRIYGGRMPTVQELQAADRATSRARISMNGLGIDPATQDFIIQYGMAMARSGGRADLTTGRGGRIRDTPANRQAGISGPSVTDSARAMQRSRTNAVQALGEASAGALTTGYDALGRVYEAGARALRVQIVGNVAGAAAVGGMAAGGPLGSLYRHIGGIPGANALLGGGGGGGGGGFGGGLLNALLLGRAAGGPGVLGRLGMPAGGGALGASILGRGGLGSTLFRRGAAGAGIFAGMEMGGNFLRSRFGHGPDDRGFHWQDPLRMLFQAGQGAATGAAVAGAPGAVVGGLLGLGRGVYSYATNRQGYSARNQATEAPADSGGNGVQTTVQGANPSVGSKPGQNATSRLRVFYPVSGATVTQKFGARNSRDRGGHPGTDFAAPLGTPIVACEDGQVIQAGPASGFGNWIVVKHPDGYYTVYGHMFNDGVLVRSGQQVKGGSRIGKVGNNGVSTGAHCHLEVHNGWPGQRVDPEGWLRGHGAANAPSGGAATTDAADTNAQKQANTPQALGPGASNYGSREEIDTLGGALGHTAAGNTTQASSQQNKAAAPDDSGAQPTVAGSNAVGDVLANARTILRVAKSMGVDKLGGQIGIMTALTESGLKNLPGGDADSAGLFQQRPSQHWGTLAQVTNPNYAAGKFFAALKQGDWHDEAPWLEAQHVQRSAFSSGSNYRAQWGRAQQIVNQIGFATGAWNVGQTGQRTIHQDEMVLPAGVAEPFRAWMTNQGRTPSSAGNVNQSKPSQNFHGPIVALTLSMPVTTAQQLDARTARQFVGHITNAMENDQRLQRIAMDVVGQVSP